MTREITIEKIKNGTISRPDRLKVYKNAKSYFQRGILKDDPEEVMLLIETISVPPLQEQYVFMGYCPNASLENRQDDIWIADGICEFNWVSSEKQLNDFYEIMVGDTIILKKRETFGKTMKISAHGKIIKREESRINKKLYFRVDWRVPKEFLIVPLMGCNATVNPRSIEHVDAEMSEDFWEWLKEGVV